MNEAQRCVSFCDFVSALVESAAEIMASDANDAVLSKEEEARLAEQYVRDRVPAHPDVPITRTAKECRSLLSHAFLCNIGNDIVHERKLKPGFKEGGLDLSRLFITANGHYEPHGEVAKQKILCLIQYLWATREMRFAASPENTREAEREVRWEKIRGFDSFELVFKWLNAEPEYGPNGEQP